MMVRLYKIKFIKDTDLKKIGEIGEATKKNASGFVNAGYAEYVTEAPKPKKEPKPRKVKEEKPKEEEQLLSIEETKQRLKEMMSLDVLDVEEALIQLAKDSGKKITKLREQLELYKKEIKDTKKSEKTKEDSIFEGWVGTIQRKPSYFSTRQDIISNGVPKEYWQKLADRLEIVRTALQKDVDPTLKERVLSFLNLKKFGEATEPLVQDIKRRNFIYTTKEDKASEMWIYNEGIYIPNGESYIKEETRRIMEDNYSDWLANQVIAKIKTDTYIESDNFFKEKLAWEIPVENGILDILNLVLMPFDPKKIYLSKIPITYQEGATCPKIEQFLKDILSCPEDIDVFYELAGFGLVKEYFLEKAFMFVGNGRNGKSKSIELLKRLVGTFNCASVPLSAITSESPFVQSLWRRHFNLAGDISSSDLKETGMFKQLTGRDPISANRKYKNVVEFTNYAKMVFACNDLPRVYDYSDGFWERWVLLEFPYKFVDKEVFENTKADERKNLKIKDPEIIKKITDEEEMSGFLNMALLGLCRIRENKKFSYTKGTKEVKDRWIRKADSFMAFCMDNLEDDYESKIGKKELRKKYKEYCSKHKVGGVSDKSIKATLQEMFGVSEEYSKVSESNFNQEYVWTGIKFKIGVF